MAELRCYLTLSRQVPSPSELGFLNSSPQAEPSVQIFRTGFPSPVRIGQRRIHFRAKYLKIYYRAKCFELIVEITQPLQTIVNVEKSPLPSHGHGSDSSNPIESEISPTCEVFRTIQLSSDQELRCGVRGITLNFGDNGAGNSGYARVAKNYASRGS